MAPYGRAAAVREAPVRAAGGLHHPEPQAVDRRVGGGDFLAPPPPDGPGRRPHPREHPGGRGAPQGGHPPLPPVRLRPHGLLRLHHPRRPCQDAARADPQRPRAQAEPQRGPALHDLRARPEAQGRGGQQRQQRVRHGPRVVRGVPEEPPAAGAGAPRGPERGAGLLAPAHAQGRHLPAHERRPQAHGRRGAAGHQHVCDRDGALPQERQADAQLRPVPGGGEERPVDGRQVPRRGGPGGGGAGGGAEGRHVQQEHSRGRRPRRRGDYPGGRSDGRRMRDQLHGYHPVHQQAPQQDVRVPQGGARGEECILPHALALLSEPQHVPAGLRHHWKGQDPGPHPVLPRGPAQEPLRLPDRPRGHQGGARRQGRLHGGDQEAGGGHYHGAHLRHLGRDHHVRQQRVHGHARIRAHGAGREARERARQGGGRAPHDGVRHGRGPRRGAGRARVHFGRGTQVRHALRCEDPHDDGRDQGPAHHRVEGAARGRVHRLLRGGQDGPLPLLQPGLRGDAGVPRRPPRRVRHTLTGPPGDPRGLPLQVALLGRRLPIWQRRRVPEWHQRDPTLPGGGPRARHPHRVVIPGPHHLPAALLRLHQAHQAAGLALRLLRGARPRAQRGDRVRGGLGVVRVRVQRRGPAGRARVHPRGRGGLAHQSHHAEPRCERGPGGPRAAAAAGAPRDAGADAQGRGALLARHSAPQHRLAAGGRPPRAAPRPRRGGWAGRAGHPRGQAGRVPRGGRPHEGAGRARASGRDPRLPAPRDRADDGGAAAPRGVRQRQHPGAHGLLRPGGRGGREEGHGGLQAPGDRAARRRHAPPGDRGDRAHLQGGGLQLRRAVP
mmetsp:Transcript_40560/g.129320  ORF Transcript_40560/g.129320 Transcript_40560/m.129320 type:complete len:834 (+) Transcript_40560:1356-3857(+)